MGCLDVPFEWLGGVIMDEDLKEKEIKRLITPLTYKKSKWGAMEVYDCEGNPVRRNVHKKYVLAPNNALLSHEEIIKYAPDSVEASRSRLKLGIGRFSDKLKVYSETLIIVAIFGFMAIMLPIAISYYISIIMFILILIGVIYFLFIHDFTDYTIEENVKSIDMEPKASTNDDLLLLFESKEKIAREMIEKRFPSPQMTNTKFNSVLDSCHDIVESQINILDSLILNDKNRYEFDSRKKLVKELISKVDDLTNELILSDDSDIVGVIEEVDNLINSVKDYKYV